MVSTVFLGILLAVIASIAITRTPAPAALTVLVSGAVISAGVSAAARATIVTLAVLVIQNVANSIKGTVSGAFSNFDECSCGEHFAQCAQSNINKRLPDGTFVCDICLRVCTSTKQWPDYIPISGGGPLNLNATCQYW